MNRPLPPDASVVITRSPGSPRSYCFIIISAAFFEGIRWQNALPSPNTFLLSVDESDEGNGGASETTDVSFLDGRMTFSASRYIFGAFMFTARLRLRLLWIFGAGFVPKPPDGAAAQALSSELLEGPAEAERRRCFFDTDTNLRGRALKANAYLRLMKSTIENGTNIASATSPDAAKVARSAGERCVEKSASSERW